MSHSLHTVSFYFGSHPEITTKYANYFRSDEYQTYIKELSSNYEEAVRLTLILLNGISLCPLAVARKENVLHIGPDTVFVNLTFNRIVNIVGAFVMPASSPLIKQLQDAIAENLNSRKFKAATMHRRLDKLVTRHCNRYSKAASASLEATMRAAGMWPMPLEAKNTEAGRKRYDEFYAQTLEATNQYEEGCKSRLLSRISRVARAAYTGPYQGNFNDIMMWIAMEHVYPHTTDVTH